jgi:two-component system, OmpR family, alkaline phosphatase synthesis response regulator PhoP
VATILVIDDDPCFRDLLQLHLFSAGHEVHTAKDPEEGIRSLLEDSADLILLDLDLPYLSGFEVLEALRSDPASQKIPIIVVTGRGDDEAYTRCHKTGVDGFLTKPLKKEQLIKAVGETLAAHSGIGRSAAKPGTD